MLIELERMNLMKYFLTSSASIPESYKVNTANGFIENLKNAGSIIYRVDGENPPTIF